MLGHVNIYKIPDAQRQFYDLYFSTLKDVPNLPQSPPPSFEDFLEKYLDKDRSPAEGVLLAIHQSELVGFSQMMLRKAMPNVVIIADFLILDEPTNNLDLVNLEFLEQALSKFEGAIIVISHDATFLVDDRLFFQSVFLVSRSKLPRLKQELRDLMIEFADTHQEPDGDAIVNNMKVGLVPR